MTRRTQGKNNSAGAGLVRWMKVPASLLQALLLLMFGFAIALLLGAGR